jgi:hypothetical protein
MNEQVNPVRIRNGTAAVYANITVVDKNQSLGKPEKADGDL